MIFFNDEGTENGGLIFDGKMVGGKPIGGGSLSFDRYEQDQVVQMLADEDGNERTAGFNVFDRPNTRITFDLLDRVEKLPVNERAAFYERTGLKGRNRVFVGRSADGASSVVLRDAAGRARLVLSVTAGGAARLTFLDPTGKSTRTISG